MSMFRRQVAFAFPKVLAAISQRRATISPSHVTSNPDPLIPSLTTAAMDFANAVHRAEVKAAKKKKKSNQFQRSGDQGDCTSATPSVSLQTYMNDGDPVGGAKFLLTRGVTISDLKPGEKSEIEEAEKKFKELNELDKLREVIEDIVTFLNQSYPVVGSMKEWQDLKELRTEIGRVKYNLSSLWTRSEYTIDPAELSESDITEVKEEAKQLGLEYLDFDSVKEAEYTHYWTGNWKRFL